MLRKRTKTIIMLSMSLVIFLSLCVGLYCGIKKFEKNWSGVTGVTLLSSAVYCYNQEYKDIPEDLETILKTGYMGLDSKYSARNGQVEIYGVPVKYLKATNSGIIIAVFYFDNGKIGYVIKGDGSSHFTDGNNLRYLLAEDNKLRKKHNEPYSWPLK